MTQLDLSKSLEQIAADLVSIPSETGSETQIVDSIEEVLFRQCNSNNFQFTRCDNSIVAEYFLRGSQKTIGLVGHTDTVSASRENQTEALIIDDDLIGLGAVDMKSSDAMMLKLCYELTHETFTPNYKLKFVFYDGEEGPLPNGITRLIDDGPMITDIDFAYVLEPTEGRYEIGCLGTITAKIIVEGESAHSASPWNGKNSIYESVDVIDKVRYFEDNSVIIDGFDATETMNITRIETPNAHNMVPAQTNLFVNYRFSPNRTIESARQILEEVCGTDNTIEYLDESPSAYVPVSGFHTMKDGVKKGILRGWTDIAQLINAGIPSVNFGPGSISVAHKPEEYISVKELNAFYVKLKEHL